VTRSPAPVESHSPNPPNSDEPRIDIYLFHCGHGDTILVRLPGDRWGLVDCYLPEQYGIRDAFFEFLAQHQIKTLEFIIQTHPDRDHYHGMKAVIEHFLDRGETIGYYIDTGLNAVRAGALLRDLPAAKEYQVLQDSLEEWAGSGRLKWRELAARHIPFIPRGFRGRIELVPIGPDPDEKRRLMTSGLRKLANRSDARLVANELSLIVVLLVNIGGRGLGVLLGADASTAGLEWALDYWGEHTSAYGLAPEFDVIKVPHHGSIRSHSPRLCRMKRPGSGTAAVSAGTRSCLPDREVLRDYLEQGWSVMATTTRSKRPSPSSLPLTLAGRGRPEVDAVGRFSVHISWTPAGGLLAEPAEARITPGDLEHYETAHRA
jgi:beta-lactamase superfamily II metal-dependent hydrolase